MRDREGDLFEGFNFDDSFGVEGHEAVLDGFGDLLWRSRPRRLEEGERHDRFRSISRISLCVCVLDLLLLWTKRRS